MNKKDMIRSHLLKQREGHEFTAKGLAYAVNKTLRDRSLTIAEKDVGNVTRELLKSGALTRTKPELEFIYRVNGNAMVLHFSKNPITGTERRPNRPDTVDQRDTPQPTHKPAPARRQNRPLMVRAIDEEIAMHRAKIKLLEGWRKDYVK